MVTGLYDSFHTAAYSVIRTFLIGRFPTCLESTSLAVRDPRKSVAAEFVEVALAAGTPGQRLPWESARKALSSVTAIAYERDAAARRACAAPKATKRLKNIPVRFGLLAANIRNDSVLSRVVDQRLVLNPNLNVLDRRPDGPTRIEKCH
jgi:hypothetical protein